MNQEVKQAWINALRSGEYKQGTRALRVGDEFCCLGVLTDLYIKKNEGEVGDWVNPVPPLRSSFNNTASYLPDEVKEWAGLKQHNPLIITGPSSKTLAGANDDGYTFEQIADLIEQYL